MKIKIKKHLIFKKKGLTLAYIEIRSKKRRQGSSKLLEFLEIPKKLNLFLWI